MNLYFRLLWTALIAKIRSSISALDDYSSSHIVWPNDLDLLGHVNNSRYCAIGDLVRIRWLIRSGLWKKLKKVRVYPVLAGQTIQYRKPLTPFQRYKVRSRTIGWDERFFYIEHRFMVNQAVYAVLLAKAMFIGPKKTRMSPADVLRLGGIDNVEPVKLDAMIESWNESSNSHWARVGLT